MSDYEYDALGNPIREDGYTNAELEAMERQERERDAEEDDEEEESEDEEGS